MTCHVNAMFAPHRLCLTYSQMFMAQNQDLHMRFICFSLKLATSIPCNVILYGYIIISISESGAILSSIGQDDNFPTIKFQLYIT